MGYNAYFVTEKKQKRRRGGHAWAGGAIRHMRGNRLLEAHLCGAFTVMDTANAPDDLVGYRIDSKSAHETSKDGCCLRAPIGRSLSQVASNTMRQAVGLNAVLLSQVLAFDWTQPLTSRVWMNGPELHTWYFEDGPARPPRDAIEYRYSTRPEPPNCGMLTTLRELNHAVMQAQKAANDKVDQRRAAVAARLSYVYAPVDYTYPLYMYCTTFFNQIVLPLLSGGDFDNTRIVCGVS
jgi:hypothetical protein